MDPTLQMALQFAGAAAGSMVAQMVTAITAGDVSTMEQLAAVSPTAEVYAARDAAARVAARTRNHERLRRDAGGGE
jgi:hypothetical protein